MKSWHILGISAVIQIGLLIYADHVDAHPERYGGLRYTDVDWRVVIDGASHIFRKDGKRAEGWLVQLLDLPVGEYVLRMHHVRKR